MEKHLVSETDGYIELKQGLHKFRAGFQAMGDEWTEIKPLLNEMDNKLEEIGKIEMEERY